MARLVTSGFEWGDAISEGQSGSGLGAATFSTTTVRSGRFSLSNGGLPFGYTLVLGTTYFARIYIYIAALPASATPILAFDIGTSATRTGLIRLETDGTLTLRFGGSGGATQVGSASEPLNTGQWYRLELAQLIDTSSIDTLDARIDGVSFASGSSLAISDTAGALRCMAASPDANTFIDDFALNDSTGVSQNSFPGEGKIVLDRAISLNANGGSWTDSAAATTSAALTDAVDNTPPTGIADTTASAGHQNRNAGANSSLDMNLATYVSLGIGPNDKITVLLPMVNVAAPVSTSGKSGSYGIVSNPVIAQRAFTGGSGTATLYWRGVAAGTYPTGWGWEIGTVTYNPVVDVNTSPVARLAITGGTTTRIAMADAMAMYVEYVPVAQPSLPPATPILVRLMRGMGGKLRRLHDNILIPDYQFVPSAPVYTDADTPFTITAVSATEVYDVLDAATVPGVTSIPIGVVSFPSTSDFTDDFNRANANPAGAPWALADNGASTSNIQISGSQFQPSGGTSSITMAYYTGKTYTDVDVGYDIDRLLSSTQSARVLARIQNVGGSSAGYYAAYNNNSGSPTITVGTFTRFATNPAFTAQATTSVSALSANDAIGIRVRGNVVEAYTRRGGVWDSTPVATWTDGSSLYSSGYVGVSANTSAASTLGDNFFVGIYVPATETAQYVDANTPGSITTPSATETTDFVDADTPSSVTTVSSLEVFAPYIDRGFVTPLLITLGERVRLFRLLNDNILGASPQPPSVQYTDADTISSVTSVQSSESVDFLDTAGAITGTSSITSTELAAYVDSDTVGSVSSVSATDVAADVESATIASVTTPSATEVAAYVDSTTVSSITSLTAAEVLAGTDSNTVSGTTTPSASDTAQYVDADVPASITSVISIELFVPYIDRGFITPLLITLGQRVRLFKLLHDNILGESPQPTSVQYTDAATISSVTSISATETAQYVESATIASNTAVSSAELEVAADSATVSSQSSVISSDVSATTDPNTGATVTTVISLETAQYVDSDTISTVSSITSSDVAAYVDVTTVGGITSVSSAELHEIPDTGTVSGTSSVITVDTAQYVESGTVATVTSLGYTDVASYIDADAPTSITSVSSADFFAPGGVKPATQVLLIQLAKYHRQLRLLGSNTLASPQPAAAIYQDSTTISSVTSVSSNEVAAYVDSTTVSTKTTPSATDATDVLDSNTVSGKTTPSTNEIAAYVESATVGSVSTPSATEVSAYVDASTVSGVTSISSTDIKNTNTTDSDTIPSTTNPSAVESYQAVDAATVNSSSTPTTSDNVNYIDGFTPSSLTSPFSTDTAQYVESSTVTVRTQISYSEIYTQATGYLDSATVASKTYIISDEEFFILGAFAFTGTLRQRWSAESLIGHYGTVAINSRWHAIDAIGRLTGFARRRWTATWRG